jgi:hypothetical protein
MSFSKPLGEREKALEEAFFREANAKLIEALRARRAEAEQRDALSKALGIADETVLLPLRRLGIRVETVAALVLAPLFAVAWADHQLDDDERRQLIAAEAHYGIDPNSDAGKLLASWLEARPHETLLEAWVSYAQELCKTLQATEREGLRSEIVGRARHIVRGFEKAFLRGRGISRAESEVLEKIEAAFSGAK